MFLNPTQITNAGSRRDEKEKNVTDFVVIADAIKLIITMPKKR